MRHRVTSAAVEADITHADGRGIHRMATTTTGELPDVAVQFHAPVLRLDEGIINHCLPLPEEAVAVFIPAGIRRVLATLNGRLYRRGIITRADGNHMLLLGQPLLREIGAREGDMVQVLLEADPEPDAVDVPEEFEAALAMDDAAHQRFEALTPGMQRSLVMYISTAKRSETRITRSLEMARKLRENTLHGDKKNT